ncbi:MAG: DNA methyltransferase [Clostridia bacterium]|nr:DNA methyltransferase [Clostridia bacterium]
MLKEECILIYNPNNFKLENTSIWNFKKRGCWATHKGDYRGNCPPQVPRNLILKYTKLNDIVLDPFCGSGTTLIECKLLKRIGIGIDVNINALKIAKSRFLFDYNLEYIPKLVKADSTNLKEIIPNDKIDFIFCHPPYANIIKYSNDIKSDISRLSLDNFLTKINLFSKECFRILKKDKFCSILIGDIRKHKNVIPLGFYIMNIFIQNKFTLKEIIIKEQHNCKMTDYWRNKKIDFYLLAHEYIFVFKKDI